MVRPIALCCVSWFLCTDLLPAQGLNLAFQHLNQDNGLSQGVCTFTSRDSRGFVWIGTIDGLNRFDGQQVKVYRIKPGVPHSLMGNNITSRCFEDRNGDLWFTTYNAVHRYNRALDQFDVFQIKDKKNHILSEDYYAFHFDREDRLWYRVGLGEEGYLHIFDCKNQKDSMICPLDGHRACAVTDANGTVSQVVTSMFPDRKGLVVTEMTSNHRQTAWLYDEKKGPSFDTNEATVQGDSVVWVGLSEGLGKINLKNGRFGFYTTFDDNAIGGVWMSCAYGANLLFVATLNQGLLVFDKQQERFIQQFKQQGDIKYGLQSNEVRDLFIDPEENLWISQWTFGMTYVNLRKSKFHFLPQTKGRVCLKMHALPGGNILCNTPNGVYVYTPQKTLVDSLSNQLSTDRFPVYLTPMPGRKDLYFARNLLLKRDGSGHNLKVVQKLESQSIRQIISLPNGEKLAACYDGLYRVETDKYSNTKLFPCAFSQPVSFKGISSIALNRKGFLLVSDNSDQLLVFEPTAAGWALRKRMSGLGECKAFYHAAASGDTWIASTIGLHKLTSELDLHMLNEAEDGLPNETFYAVLPDRQGRFWLPGNSGLWCYDPGSRSSHCYKPEDGLFFREFNTGSWYQSPNGEIWAGGVGGAVTFHPDSIRPVPFKPRVQFTQILINDTPMSGAQAAGEVAVLNRPYSENTLSFEFVALEFSDPKANQMEYRLIGSDNKWVKSGAKGFARYARLPPGHYTFEVRAANSDGEWTDTPKILAITIQTPFWQTWWFYLLCALSAGGLIYGGFWYRLQQVLRIERMRVQISSDLHDDVGTLLAGLAMQSEALEISAPEKDKGKLQRISEISRNAMSHMRDTVWAIDARKDKVENLLDRMREHAEETLTPKDFRFDLTVDNLSLKQNLPTELRQALYLIYKEAVTNAAKHSNGDTVSVRLKKMDRGLEMRICDNGSVPEKTYKTTGLGTSNMRMRAEKIGASLDITRENGFCLTLRIDKLP